MKVQRIPKQREERFVRRSGCTLKVRHPEKAMKLTCDNAGLAKDVEEVLTKNEAEVKQIPADELKPHVMRLLMYRDAARWQAEKRVRGTRIPKFSGGYR